MPIINRRFSWVYQGFISSSFIHSLLIKHSLILLNFEQVYTPVNSTSLLLTRLPRIPWFREHSCQHQQIANRRRRIQSCWTEYTLLAISLLSPIELRNGLRWWWRLQWAQAPRSSSWRDCEFYLNQRVTSSNKGFSIISPLKMTRMEVCHCSINNPNRVPLRAPMMNQVCEPQHLL
jgi:hypothetical protein